MSLCTCVGGAVSHILRKSTGAFTGLSIKAEAERRTEHPTYFKSLELDIKLESSTVSAAQLQEAILLAESDISPVWNMIKDTVSVTFTSSVSGGTDSDRLDRED